MNHLKVTGSPPSAHRLLQIFWLDMQKSNLFVVAYLSSGEWRRSFVGSVLTPLLQSFVWQEHYNNDLILAN